MPARFYEQEVKSGLKNKRKLSAYLDQLVAGYLPAKSKSSLNYIFCGDEFLHQMNRDYLKHDTLTDIITFDLSDDGPVLTGEIYISTDRVKENAKKFGVSFENELHRVIFHGALHLCGLKDKKEKDREIMRASENKCLDEYATGL